MSSRKNPEIFFGGRPIDLMLCRDPEDGGDMFLQNVGSLSTEYTAPYLRRYNSS
jgi:hypothetical protein